MNQQILAFASCRLAQTQVSPAASFLRQSRRALSIAANSSVSSQYYASHSILPILPFLHPYAYRPNSRCSQVCRRTTPFPAPKQLSAFSTTQPKQATRVLLNPRTDDDGKPLMIDISPRAAQVWDFFFVLFLRTINFATARYWASWLQGKTKHDILRLYERVGDHPSAI